MKAEDNPVLFSEVIETVRDANKQIEDDESGNVGSSDFNMVKETGDDWLNNSPMVKGNAYNRKPRAESGSGSVLDNANYAQKTYSSTFSPEGIKKYSDLTGEPINTVDDLVNAINNGKISVNDLPIEYIVRDGTTLILNTRTAQALKQAGIPRNQWMAVDRTGNQLFEQLLDGQLSRNKLTSEGISTVRPGGKK